MVTCLATVRLRFTTCALNQWDCSCNNQWISSLPCIAGTCRHSCSVRELPNHAISHLHWRTIQLNEMRTTVLLTTPRGCLVNGALWSLRAGSCCAFVFDYGQYCALSSMKRMKESYKQTTKWRLSCDVHWCSQKINHFTTSGIYVPALGKRGT